MGAGGRLRARQRFQTGLRSNPRACTLRVWNLLVETDRLVHRLRPVDLGETTEGAARSASALENVPEPARGQATVRFPVPERQDMRRRLYAVLGQQVRTVRQGELEGRQELEVDLSGLSSGTYFLRLEADGAIRPQKLAVAR